MALAKEMKIANDLSVLSVFRKPIDTSTRYNIVRCLDREVIKLLDPLFIFSYEGSFSLAKRKPTLEA